MIFERPGLDAGDDAALNLPAFGSVAVVGLIRIQQPNHTENQRFSPTVASYNFTLMREISHPVHRDRRRHRAHRVDDRNLEPAANRMKGAMPSPSIERSREVAAAVPVPRRFARRALGLTTALARVAVTEAAPRVLARLLDGDSENLMRGCFADIGMFDWRVVRGGLDKAIEELVRRPVAAPGDHRPASM